MRQEIIICDHCGGVRIVRDAELNCSAVQEINPDTGKLIGDLKIFDIYKCLSCGERVCLEKSETAYKLKRRWRGRKEENIGHQQYILRNWRPH